MKNLEKYAEAGAAKIRDNSRFDLQIDDMQSLLDLANNAGAFEAIHKAFLAGVEAGARIQAKKA